MEMPLLRTHNGTMEAITKWYNQFPINRWVDEDRCLLFRPLPQSNDRNEPTLKANKVAMVQLLVLLICFVLSFCPGPLEQEVTKLAIRLAKDVLKACAHYRQ